MTETKTDKIRINIYLAPMTYRLVLEHLGVMRKKGDISDFFNRIALEKLLKTPEQLAAQEAKTA